MNYTTFLPLKYNVSHTASSITVNPSTNLNQGPTDEDFAFREVRVFLDLCHPSCASCTNPTACTSCTGSDFMSAGTCVSACPSGTYGYSGRCESCPNHCLTCASGTQCTKCATGYYFLNGQCTSICPFYTTAVTTPILYCSDARYTTSTSKVHYLVHGESHSNIEKFYLPLSPSHVITARSAGLSSWIPFIFCTRISVQVHVSVHMCVCVPLCNQMGYPQLSKILLIKNIWRCANTHAHLIVSSPSGPDVSSLLLFCPPSFSHILLISVRPL